jgi:hypothetical protein
MPRTTIKWKGQFDLEWVIRGKTYHDRYQLNALYNQGEQDVLEGYFRGAALPTDFKVGLLTNAYVIDEAHSMTQIAASELTNVTAPGYSARMVVSRDASGWPTSQLDSGDWLIKTATVQWTATDAWSVRAGFIFVMSGGATAPANNTGRIVACAALLPTRQLEAVNDVCKATYSLKLQ